MIDPGVSRKVGSILPHGGTFEFASDRPLRWTKSDDIWISGLFHYGYADDTLKVKSIDIDKKTITSEQAHGYGFSTGKPWNRWTALNLLEEIQLPGEFVADKRSGKLYFLPPDKKDVTSKSVYEVSVLKDPLISVKGASAVILEGLFIECSRGTGVCIVNGTNNHIQKCTFRNLGVLAVTLGKGSPVVPSQSSKWDLGDIAGYLYGHPLFNSEAGTDNGIVNCSIYNIGAGAISLAGGDRSSLQPGRNFVENCDIHHFNRWDRTYRSAVNIYGVGNIVRHCTIHDCPGSAILLHGNDHLIEYNEIYHALYDADDMGAFYMGRDPTERGNVFRYNYIHEVAEKGHVQCMYFDDNGGEGSLVYGNIFRHAGSTCVIYVNGGSDITIDNNIFIDCVDVAHVRWRDDLLPSIESGRFQQILQLTPYKESPWKEKYPQLLDYEANRKTLPRRQMIKNNLLVNSKPASKGTQKEENNWSTNGNPGFVDFNNGDYTLTGFADVFHHIPGFKAIPMDRIGISK